MSTELKTCSDSYDLLRFWGGNEDGLSFQVTLKVEGASGLSRLLAPSFKLPKKDIPTFFYHKGNDEASYDPNTETFTVKGYEPVHMSERRYAALCADLTLCYGGGELAKWE